LGNAENCVIIVLIIIGEWSPVICSVNMCVN
jgi:hypothetical protein